ncbi:uncharacterized protein LOC128550876 [Mercenaria mercenaria]|uniref:uncharacterized protein LOC128550876 n=1 Tax=Mercenaria mercenaria TaxID=6596 RepID=UPI00234E792B|nr:uncharacterized protein LOC128550876 [Mercenaria mercenaria]
MASAKLITDKIKTFVEKYDENHHEIVSEFNKLELNKVLCKTDIQGYTSNECNEVTAVLDKALGIVESKSKEHILYPLFTAKDRLQKARIEALMKQLEHCTCKAGDLTLVKDPEWGQTDDTRLISETGDGLVVQPTDSFHDSHVEGQ